MLNRKFAIIVSFVSFACWDGRDSAAGSGRADRDPSIVINQPDGWVYALDIDGKYLGRVGRGYLPRWSPHGVTVAMFQWDYDQGEESLVVVDVKSERLNRVARSRRHGEFGFSSVSWSSDGRYLAYNETRGSPWISDLHTVTVDGRHNQRLTFDGFNHEPRWSPDGKMITFWRCVPGGKIMDRGYLIAADGTGMVPVEYSGVVWCSPVRWSPDGQLVAFYGKADSLHLSTPWIDLFVAQVSSDRAVRLTNDGESGGPEWSPSGEKILFLGFHLGSVDLAIMNRDGTGASKLTSHGRVHHEASLRPMWSADGMTIAYWYARPNGSPKLHFVRIDGTGDRELEITANMGYDWKRR